MHLASYENFRANIAKVIIDNLVLEVRSIIKYIKDEDLLLEDWKVLKKKNPHVIAFKISESMCFTVRKMST